jgi:small-conductance mechanosensitive channel
MINFSLSTIGYLSAVVVIGIACSLLIVRLLRKWEEQRQQRVIGKRKLHTPITTTSPLKNPYAKAQAAATKSINARFSIIRRLSVMLLLLVGAAVAIMPFLGELPNTLISLIVGAASVVIGMAAKPFLENFIAGIVLTFSRPFRVGDTVLIDEDYYGTIEDITMTYTIIKVWDWRRYVIPNYQMMTKDFVNLTLQDSFVWCHVEFWVAPDTDIDLVTETAKNAACSSAAFVNHEPPEFWVMEMGEKGIRCWIAAWSNTPADAWQLGSDIRTELVRNFKDLRISPHRFSLDINSNVQNNIDLAAHSAIAPEQRQRAL